MLFGIFYLVMIAIECKYRKEDVEFILLRWSRVVRHGDDIWRYRGLQSFDETD